MSDRSAIEWTDASWNPLRGTGPSKWMCQKISPGCDRCYASTFNVRLGGDPYPSVKSNPGGIDISPTDGKILGVRLDEKALMLPHSWKKPRRVFVASMTDLFGAWVPDTWLDRIFDAMEDEYRHTFILLTKRPRRMQAYINRRWTHAYQPQFIWAGVTIESDAYAWRANVLRETNAAVRWISAEPLLGPLPSLDLTGIDWLVTGGESGHGARPIDADWVRALRDRAQANGTSFFHKQWGGRTPKAGGRELDGREWSEFPRTAVPS